MVLGEVTSYFQIRQSKYIKIVGEVSDNFSVRFDFSSLLFWGQRGGKELALLLALDVRLDLSGKQMCQCANGSIFVGLGFRSRVLSPTPNVERR
jgi:hypothetical protein